MENRKNIISPLMKINNSGEEKMSKKIMTLLIAVAAIGMFAAEPQNLLVLRLLSLIRRRTEGWRNNAPRYQAEW